MSKDRRDDCRDTLIRILHTLELIASAVPPGYQADQQRSSQELQHRLQSAMDSTATFIAQRDSMK